MRYGLRLLPGPGIDSITVELDGDSLTVRGKQPQAKVFAWPGAGESRQVLIRVKAGANIPFASYEGVWGIFRLIADADPRPPGGGVIELSKVRRGRGRPESVLDSNDHPIQVRLEITQLPSGIDVFDRPSFQIRCPSRIVE